MANVLNSMLIRPLLLHISAHSCVLEGVFGMVWEWALSLELTGKEKPHKHCDCDVSCLQVRVRKCNASCQTPPEFFPEVHNAHLCSCDHHSDPAALAASHFARECCPALEDVNQQFQPWLHEAHQMKALHPDPFVLFPQHTFRFWPYPGWFPRDDSPD